MRVYTGYKRFKTTITTDTLLKVYYAQAQTGVDPGKGRSGACAPFPQTEEIYTIYNKMNYNI